MNAHRRFRADKPAVPQSGQIPKTVAGDFLIQHGWSPFELDGQIRWIDPKRQYDISYTEMEALQIQLRR